MRSYSNGTLDHLGLVLEGGGMRGVYTSGVLEFFMEHDYYFPYIIGVSSGACCAVSYLSRQKGRNKKVMIDFVNYPGYISYKNMLTRKGLFGFDLIFNELPNKLVPFDFGRFESATEKLIVGTTDSATGEPLYFDMDENKKDLLSLLRASCSLPFMSPVVPFKGKILVDGGISDPIPIRKSERDGKKKNIVILTQMAGYRKKQVRFKWFIKKYYRRYKGIVEAMIRRHDVYNRTLEYLEQKEASGEVILFRPSDNHGVGRVERDARKLERLYQQGYEDAKKRHDDLKRFMEEGLVLT